jgi:hypothetical protein
LVRARERLRIHLLSGLALDAVQLRGHHAADAPVEAPARIRRVGLAALHRSRFRQRRRPSDPSVHRTDLGGVQRQPGRARRAPEGLREPPGPRMPDRAARRRQRRENLQPESLMHAGIVLHARGPADALRPARALRVPRARAPGAPSPEVPADASARGGRPQRRARCRALGGGSVVGGGDGRVRGQRGVGIAHHRARRGVQAGDPLGPAVPVPGVDRGVPLPSTSSRSSAPFRSAGTIWAATSTARACS